MQCAGALQELGCLREILRRIRLRRVSHQRFDLLLGRLRDALQSPFGIRVEHHVLRGEILLPGLEQFALLLRGLAQAVQPLRFRLLRLPLLLVGGKG